MEKLKMDLKYHKLSLLIRLIVNIAAILTVGVLIAIVVYILYRGIPNITPQMFEAKYTSENASVVLELDKEKCLVLMKGQEIHLTSTEYKLLLYLMENRGRVVTKAMLLEQLWDIDGNFVDDNTVRVNIKRLRQKLNDEKQEYIVTVFGMGYSFGE